MQVVELDVDNGIKDMTSHEKIEPSALPVPEVQRPSEGRTYEVPRNAVEEVLARISAEALGVERVGSRDNFFELGGQSLLLTRVFAQIIVTLQVELPLSVLFENPSVLHWAAAVLELAEDPEALMESAELALQVSELSDEEVEAMLRERQGG